MLKTEKSITLSGQVLIDNQQVAYLSASVSNTNGSANVTKTITNPELYEANKAACRSDFVSFNNEVYAVEDSLMEEMKGQ